MARIQTWPIPSYSGYRITKDGRVFSETKRTGPYANRGLTELSLSSDRYGYLIAHLYVDGHHVYAKAHRLVALTFLPAPTDKKSQVRHLDGDPKNNDWTNLAWGSAKENAIDRDRHGRTNKHKDGKLAPEVWVKMAETYLTGRHTQHEVAEMFGVSFSYVSSIWRRYQVAQILGIPIEEVRRNHISSTPTQYTRAGSF